MDIRVADACTTEILGEMFPRNPFILVEEDFMSWDGFFQSDFVSLQKLPRSAPLSLYFFLCIAAFPTILLNFVVIKSIQN